MDEPIGDPFQQPGRIPPPDYPRRALAGIAVAVLSFHRTRRQLRLIRPNTRAIRRHEIHELIGTDEAAAMPGGQVDRAAGLAFVEFTTGGLLAEGDRIVIDGVEIGAVVGFDETHMPNHQNIVLRTRELMSGVVRGLALGASFEFLPPAGSAR